MEQGGVLAVIIDGGADLLHSVNDEAESNAMVARLVSTAGQIEAPVIVVIHENHGAEKARGHLGSQLERKAESVIRMEKDREGITSVWAPLSAAHQGK